MNTQITRPRQIAQHMITAFIDAKEANLVLPDELALFEAQAKTHARNTAALIVFHSRRHRESRTHQVPGPLWPLVLRYEAARRPK